MKNDPPDLYLSLMSEKTWLQALGISLRAHIRIYRRLQDFEPTEASYQSREVRPDGNWPPRGKRLIRDFPQQACTFRTCDCNCGVNARNEQLYWGLVSLFSLFCEYKARLYFPYFDEYPLRVCRPPNEMPNAYNITNNLQKTTHQTGI